MLPDGSFSSVGSGVEFLGCVSQSSTAASSGTGFALLQSKSRLQFLDFVLKYFIQYYLQQ